jgi:hypothetical protein
MSKSSKQSRILHFAARVIRPYVRQHRLIEIKPGHPPKFVPMFRAFLTHQGIQSDHLSKDQMYDLIQELWNDKDYPVFGRTNDENFYRTPEWSGLRRKILKRYGRVCMKCGGTEHIHVDHIKPRSIFPDLQLEWDNMQVLCRSCNSSKSNRKIFDCRPHGPIRKPHKGMVSVAHSPEPERFAD